jgi:hypothetical protein
MQELLPPVDYDTRKLIRIRNQELKRELKYFAGVWFTDFNTHDGGIIRLFCPDRTDRSMVGGSMVDICRSHDHV